MRPLLLRAKRRARALRRRTDLPPLSPPPQWERKLTAARAVGDDAKAHKLLAKIKLAKRAPPDAATKLEILTLLPGDVLVFPSSTPAGVPPAVGRERADL